MTQLSTSTQALLSENSISYIFNEETGKIELHFPTNNFEYLDTEEDVLNSVNDYIAYWDANN